MKVRILNITPDAERHMVEVARVSSSRSDKKEDYEGLLRYLIEHNHWSPFEHAFLTFEIETSKAIAIQLLRHRSFTFQEFSQRYQNVSKVGDEVFEKIQLRRQSKNNRQSSTDEIDWRQGYLYELVDEHLKHTNYLYDLLLKEGVSRETARMILPMCTKTKMHMSGSVRSWIHFFSVRDDEHAQLEIQLLAKEIKSIFMKQLPVISSVLYSNQ